MISFIISFSKLESTPQAAIGEIVVVLSTIKFPRQWSHWKLTEHFWNMAVVISYIDAQKR